MRTTTMRALVTGAALALAIAPVTWANAAGDTISGGCYFEGAAGVGVIGDSSVTTDASGAPISAIVACWLEDFSRAEMPGTRHYYAGTGVQSGSDPVTAPGAAFVCESVYFADGAVQMPGCQATTQLTICIQCITPPAFDAITARTDGDL
jgi:hypothetical protein